jgi:hypothetical protein
MTMKTVTVSDQTFPVRLLVDAELDRATGGLLSRSFLLGGFGIAVGDLRGSVADGIRKAALDTLLGK